VPEVQDATYPCSTCGAEWEDEYDADHCCSYSCSNCGSEFRHESDADECCSYYCSHCGGSWDNEHDALYCCGSSNEFHGEMPYLAPIDPYRVEVPSIPGRPARLCSLEQELTAGGSMVARLLHDIGASPERTVQSYHSSTLGRGTVHVEEDGSLPDEGGEVVFDRFNLSERGSTDRMSMALSKIRQLRDQPERPVKTGFAAGIHVHVSARAENGETLSPRDLTALYELWSYAEDMLYAFSAAGWNRHRQPADAYAGYCKPVPKATGTATPREVWRLMRSDRYYGLNFQRIFGAASRCTCGAAGMGDWQSCDCGAFDKATVEWRVFNSSTLPRTIHAWLLMAHAMTAHAVRHELGTLPVNPYGTQTPSEKRDVLDHLLAILPLTDGERAVIREAADRSPGL